MAESMDPLTSTTMITSFASVAGEGVGMEEEEATGEVEDEEEEDASEGATAEGSSALRCIVKSNK